MTFFENLYVFLKLNTAVCILSHPMIKMANKYNRTMLKGTTPKLYVLINSSLFVTYNKLLQLHFELSNCLIVFQ